MPRNPDGSMSIWDAPGVGITYSKSFMDSNQEALARLRVQMGDAAFEAAIRMGQAHDEPDYEEEERLIAEMSGRFLGGETSLRQVLSKGRLTAAELRTLKNDDACG